MSLSVCSDDESNPICAMHSIQRNDFEQIDVDDHKSCRQSCEDKTDYFDLCMFAIFDGEHCFHYKMTMDQFFNIKEKALFIPTNRLPYGVRIMFVRHNMGGRDVLLKVEFQKNINLLDEDSGICSTPGIFTIKWMFISFQNKYIL